MEKQLSNESLVGLRNLLKSDNDFARLHAFWILSNSGEITANEVELGLNDKNASIRENVLTISEGFINKSESVLNKVMALFLYS